MTRRPLIAGNWKMNTTFQEGLELAKQVANQVSDSQVEIVLCPPFTHLESIVKATQNSIVEVGAQNMYWENSGAFTGEISPSMLTSIGCKYVIIGHSERRELFGETNEGVNKKVHAALANSLLPIIAVGETLEEREADKTQDKIKTQVTAALEGVESKHLSGDTSASREMSRSATTNLVFAYEPIWAIGTGKTATPEQANDVTRFIRAVLGSLYTPDTAKDVRILYGGSVSPDNIDSLMIEPDIDGALVGGASLKADSFLRIINFQAS